MLTTFLSGIDVLLRQHRNWIRGKKIGLVSHLAAVNSRGAVTAELLYKNADCRLAALYAPEHGFFGMAGAGEHVRHKRYSPWRVPIYSLYGKMRRPPDAIFEKLDVILVDLQDLGARPYTYVSTLRFVLETAAAMDKPVIVADRPIPLPNIVDGAVLTPSFESFVGCVRTPMLYGMTPGEIALWLAADLDLKLDLRVARMRGYHRQPCREPGWPPWIPPSPGIRSWESAACYLATVFAEALPDIDVGRGTNLAFQLVGSTWMKSRAVCDYLAQCGLPGVAFYSHPYCPHGAGTVIDGIRLAILDPDDFYPVYTGVAIIAALQALYGVGKIWKQKGVRKDFFDKLYGTDTIRKALLRGEQPSRIRRRWQAPLKVFSRARLPCLLYEAQHNCSRGR